MLIESSTIEEAKKLNQKRIIAGKEMVFLWTQRVWLDFPCHYFTKQDGLPFQDDYVFIASDGSFFHLNAKQMSKVGF